MQQGGLAQAHRAQDTKINHTSKVRLEAPSFHPDKPRLRRRVSFSSGNGNEATQTQQRCCNSITAAPGRCQDQLTLSLPCREQDLSSCAQGIEDAFDQMARWKVRTQEETRQRPLAGNSCSLTVLARVLSTWAEICNPGPVHSMVRVSPSPQTFPQGHALCYTMLGKIMLKQTTN